MLRCLVLSRDSCAQRCAESNSACCWRFRSRISGLAAAPYLEPRTIIHRGLAVFSCLTGPFHYIDVVLFEHPRLGAVWVVLAPLRPHLQSELSQLALPLPAQELVRRHVLVWTLPFLACHGRAPCRRCKACRRAICTQLEARAGAWFCFKFAVVGEMFPYLLL